MQKAALHGRIGGSALALLLGIGLSSGAHAQDDLPPLYQVEIIIFAYDEFDPSEEVFQPLLTAADRRAAGLGPEVPQRREPFRYEDLDLEPLLGPRAPADGGLDVGSPLPEAGQGSPETGGETDAAHDPLILELDLLPLQDPQPFGLRQLSADELQLGNARATLERLSAYRPLVHVGWVQEGLPEAEALPFELSQLGRFTPTGTVQLHISQFQRLRLRVDLEYRPLEDAYRQSTLTSRFELTDVTPPPRFVLREDRVTRTGELHYFDHPAFGVLAMVRPEDRVIPQEAAVPMPAP